MHWIKNKSVKLLVIKYCEPPTCLKKSTTSHLPLAIGVDGPFWAAIENIRSTNIAPFFRSCLNIDIGSQNITFVGNYCEKQL